MTQDDIAFVLLVVPMGALLYVLLAFTCLAFYKIWKDQ